MTMALGIFAGLLLLLYSIYFIRIIKGKPQAFEIELLKSLAYWMVQKGRASKVQLWLMYLLSLIIELSYFILVFSLIANPFMQIFTAMLAGVESYHLLLVGISFKRFFASKTMITQLFNWRMERMSAVLFFTHSLLVLITLFIM